jgi:hypothetical protein
VSGKVLTSDGRPLRGATVFITDPVGNTRSAVTTALGFYQFDALTVAGTYTISVSSKRYRFSNKTVSIAGDVTDLDFTGQE